MFAVHGGDVKLMVTCPPDSSVVSISIVIDQPRGVGGGTGTPDSSVVSISIVIDQPRGVGGGTGTPDSSVVSISIVIDQPRGVRLVGGQGHPTLV